MAKKYKGEQNQIREPIRINEAANCLGVFWALLQLAEENEVHSKSNINRVLQNQYLSNPTIAKWLDFLERCGAIRCNYAKGKRRGKRDIRYTNFQPRRIPAIIYKKRVPPSTATRWKEALVEQLGRYENGKALLDAKRFAKASPQNFFDNLAVRGEKQSDSKTIYWNSETAEEWFIHHLDGENIEIDRNILEFFHRFLCWKVAMFHSDTN